MKDLIASSAKQVEDIESFGVLLQRVKKFNEVSRAFAVRILEIYYRRTGSNK